MSKGSLFVLLFLSWITGFSQVIHKSQGFQIFESYFELKGRVQKISITACDATYKFGEIGKTNCEHFLLTDERWTSSDNLNVAEFDDKGNHIKTTTERYMEKFEVDSLGSELKYEHFDSLGNLSILRVTEYDSAHRIRSEYLYEALNSESLEKTRKTSFIYGVNAKGIEYKVETRQWQSDNSIESDTTFSYQSSDGKTDSIVSDYDITVIRYDKNGNTIYRSWDGGSNSKNVAVSTYLPNGLLLSTDNSSENWSDYRYEYEFDDSGNPVQRIEFYNEQPEFIIFYNYEYEE